MTTRSLPKADLSRPLTSASLRLLFPACAFAFVCQASGQVIFEDNFDSYTDQASFEAAWEQVGAVASGVLTTDNFVSSPNGISFATTAQRNQRFFTPTGLPGTIDSEFVVRFSIDFYDTDAEAAPYRMHHNLQAGTSVGSGGLIALGLNNNLTATAEGGNFYMGRILGYTPPGSTSGAFFKLNDDPNLLRSTGWHNLAVEISAEAFRFFVDGSLAETVSHEGIPLLSYDLVRIGSGLSSGQASAVDNVKVEFVPEPSTALLLGVGIAAMGLRRRSRG